MSKLKNTFGLPESLISSVKQIHEKLHGNQNIIAAQVSPKDKITAGDLTNLRNNNKTIKSRHDPDLEPEIKNESSAQFSRDMTKANNAEIERLNSEKELRDTRKATAPEQPTTVMKMGEETLDEISDMLKGRWATAVTHNTNPLKQNQKRTKRAGDVIKTLNKKSERINYSNLQKNSYENNNELIEAPTYPYKANEIAPLLVMLRTVLNFLSSAPALKKIMREQTGLDSKNVDSLIEFLEALDQEVQLAEKNHKNDEKCSPKKPIK